MVRVIEHTIRQPQFPIRVTCDGSGDLRNVPGCGALLEVQADDVASSGPLVVCPDCHVISEVFNRGRPR